MRARAAACRCSSAQRFHRLDQINEGFDRLVDGSVLRQMLQPLP
jgi:Zn-dependent alcohol dehydrogenase